MTILFIIITIVSAILIKTNYQQQTKNQFLIDFKAAYELYEEEKLLTKKYKQEKYFINENGYPCFCDSGILVHRWMMQKIIGRKLRPGEVVHHRDGNKLNFKPNNLILFPNQETHYFHHLNNYINHGGWYEVETEKKENYSYV